MALGRILLGLIVSTVFLVLLLISVDRGEVWDAVREAEPLWIVAAAPVYALGIWVRALRWRVILRPHVALSRSDASALVVIGNAANNVLPARTGELVRALLVQRSHGGSGATTLGSIVIERALDGLVLAAFLVVTILAAGSSDFLRGLAAVAGTLFLGVTIVLAAMAWRPDAAQRWWARAVARLPERLGRVVSGLLERLFAGLTLLRGPGAWAIAIALTAASWTFEAGAYWLVGEAFGLDVSPLLYLGVAAAANLAIAAPSTAGGIGPFEFFARETVVVFGTATTEASATAYALALHALVLVPLSLVGVALLWRRELGLRTLLGRTAEADASAPDTAIAEVEPSNGERSDVGGVTS